MCVFRRGSSVIVCVITNWSEHDESIEGLHAFVAGFTKYMF